ncbi:unnamed protein product [Brachionus calyciflorus]|uniref:Uncharacterized protein n=1 Tax=Brachionus calyciflorus TaxID=104777 RepID=A0A813PR34_9BILA|nr:unnamed protein product [Brachionus calyciflorus]
MCKGIYFDKVLNVSKVTIESIFFDRMLKSWLWQDWIAFACGIDEIYRKYYATLLSIEPGRYCCVLALTRYSVGHKEETCFNTPPKLSFNFTEFKEWVN